MRCALCSSAASLTYDAASAWYMPAHFDLVDLVRDVNDDAFCYFKTTQHLSRGSFLPSTGGITCTNGYPPIGIVSRSGYGMHCLYSPGPPSEARQWNAIGALGRTRARSEQGYARQ